MEEEAMERPPQNQPMAKFFTNIVDFNNYIINFGPRSEITPRKMPTKSMSDEHRLLHYLLVWIILPRSNNHGIVINDDLVIMRALYSGVKINWSYFIAHHMGKLKDGPTTARLRYMFLWTKIFKHFNIDLSTTKEKILKDTNCINLTTLHQMGRCLGNQAQPQQGPQQVEEEHKEQAHENIGSSYNAPQPSILDLMQEIQRMNVNMTTNFLSIDRRFARVDNRIQGLYDHFGIAPPPQDENEDED
ncbi:hypothetical protein PIB30_048124 [Stylosanthes scabra]|uniref:Uncharacterized protein n=1 Tax=Stylosanthes scabra TaxID=79078 RepID=A0ABU6RHI5_9FABA|nr:hypothetical protein [Stylosanthes scabra]